ncbi:hypothetical protein U9M48_009036 [Paspalum notatum var. saurae]|uniref:Dilute domain-containing protein n=1 Tax=Paspalum notatum var. saurae TaxID=547442 RepID=A0AAQ3SQI6_PASNO
MTDCNPCSTPVDTQAKLSEDAGALVADPTAYRSLAGALQYLTFTRPDITYAVQQVCLYMLDPREPHLTALKRLLRYLSDTVDYGLLLHRSTSTELVVYTDADWAGCPDTRRSTSGYAAFLGSNLVSWSSKRQPVVSRSSAEAEYRAVANGMAEAFWLRQLLAVLHSPLAKSTLVNCDNFGVVYLSTNPVQHQRTKHVEIDLHFVRDRTFRSPLKAFGQRTSFSHVDARYPAMLFKQQLTASLEKIFGLIRDNLKKEISPLLSLCIQAPKLARGGSGRSSRSPDVALQQPISTHWDRIVKFLDSLMDRLHKNFVPSFFIRKLVTQVFSFINVQLFNSMLLRRECCTFSNGEYVKSGLCVLEKWIVDTEEEHAGAAWDELKFIRQAVDFLIIPQKSKKTLDQIKKNICPALSVRQIYRLCTMYWDDKYGTHSVSAEACSHILFCDMQSSFWLSACS